jgi:hypothetical protein
VSNEWLELAERQEHQDNLALALNWSIYDRFELGDSEAAQALHDRLKQLAESLKQPLYQAFDATWDFNWLEIAGRFEEAEARAAECFRFARRAHATFAPTLYGAQLYGLRRDQGRLDEFAQAVVPLVGPEPRLTGWRALLLTVRASRGECDAIHPELRNLTQEGALAKDGFWLATVCLLAESCTQIADRDLAATLLAQLEPYADRYAQVGLAISLGPVYRFIGLLAAQLGDEQRAESHFGAALERCLKFGARTHGTVVRCDLGELLSKRSAARERENGRELLQQARDDAQTLGMSGILARAEAAIG